MKSKKRNRGIKFFLLGVVATCMLLIPNQAKADSNLVGQKFPFHPSSNDRPQVEGAPNIVPSVVTLHDQVFYVYCGEKGHTLRTTNLYTDAGFYPGETIEIHTTRKCDDYNKDETPNTSAIYFEPPGYTITKKYDLTGRDNMYQYAGYILGNVLRNEGGVASWNAQRAFWMSSLNTGKSITATDTETELNTDIARQEEMRILSKDELGKVEDTALKVQLCTNASQVVAQLNNLINHFQTEANSAPTASLKNFFRGLNDDVDGLRGVVNWINVEVAKGETPFSNIRANAYQYLMTIDHSEATNVHKKITDKINQLSLEQGLQEEEGVSIATAGALKAEAYKYQEFYDDLQKNGGELKVINQTGNTSTVMDRSTNTYTIGPFKLEYNDAYVRRSTETRKRVNFSEIVAIRLYNEKGQLYKTLNINYTDKNGNEIAAKNEFRITKNNLVSDVDPEYIFPKSGEEFYIQFTGDGSSSAYTKDPSNLKVEVEFQYIHHYEAEIYRTDAKGVQRFYQWRRTGSARHVYDVTSSGRKKRCRYYTYTFQQTGSKDIQDLLVVSESKPIIENKIITIEPRNYYSSGGGGGGNPPTRVDDITMQLSGRVWEDENGGKESLPDGIRENGERDFKNIEVTLYEYDPNTGEAVVATLAQDPHGKEIRTNPTLTDEKGQYIFKGVRPTRRYFVQFTYNGQTYQATEYTSQTSTSVSEWPNISNASENVSTRLGLNDRFASIGSSPENYQGTNSLGYGVESKTYTQQELMGFALENKGNGQYGYVKSDNMVQLLDYYDHANNKQYDGIISTKIQEYIKSNKTYPDLKEIYDAIISEYRGQDDEIREKLQFIEDSKITAMTGTSDEDGFYYELYATRDLSNIETANKTIYPISDGSVASNKFYVVDANGNRIDFTSEISTQYKQEGRVTYYSTYEEQNNINLGLNARTTADMALKKDVQKATVEINGKVQTYDYDTRQNAGNKDATWDISVRLSDAYYGTEYSRELFPSDYDYKVTDYGDDFSKYGKEKEDEINVYVTYRVSVYNQSPSVKTRIDEIVDYYDQDYEYIEDRSSIEIPYGNNSGTYKARGQENSRYTKGSQTTTLEGYKNVYVQGLDGFYLEPGQTAYVYVTFRVNKPEKEDGEKWLILDEDAQTGNTDGFGVGKENISEINGYSTMYGDHTEVPNVGKVGGTNAGIIDGDSTPGNIEPGDVPKDGAINYEAFEDDTDKAPNIRLRLYRDDSEQRSISGVIWEDERTQTIEATTTGDGIRDDSKETKIDGITVQLVELMENGEEYIWREFGDDSEYSDRTKVSTKKIGGSETIGFGSGSGTKGQETPIVNKTGIIQNYDFGGNQKGAYAFKSFIPGNYVIRFIYGDTVRTVLVNPNTQQTDDNTKNAVEIANLVKEYFKDGYGNYIEGLNGKSYNGQDYKSTTYQKGINQVRSYVWKAKDTFKDGVKTEGEVLNTTASYNMENANQNESASDIEARKAGTAFYYDIAESDTNGLVSDAKDISIYKNRGTDKEQLNDRSKVIDYSDNDLMNHIAEVLASYQERPNYVRSSNDVDTPVDYTREEMITLLEELIQRTKMTAETGLMNIEVERNTASTPNQVKDNPTSYIITNVDLGLEERPKAQIALEKEITNIKVTLADKSVIFDANEAMNNILWTKHEWYQTGYKQNTGLLDPTKFGSIEWIRKNNSLKTGLVQISMDQEIMHGATIQITYKITARNVGEVDYKDDRFYYTGIVADKNKVVTTTPDEVIDYVANNLQFYAADNSQWKIIKAEELMTSGKVNSKLKDKLNEYKTIITTESLATPLVPKIYQEKVNSNAQHEVATSLILTQLITSENEQDDLVYRNIAEMVRIDNTVGRRQAYSVVGNQNPDADPQEMDTDVGEIVKILPPFGTTQMSILLIAGIGIVCAIIVGAGIILIKKWNVKK